MSRQFFLVEVNVPYDMYNIDEQALLNHLEDHENLGYKYKVEEVTGKLTINIPR